MLERAPPARYSSGTEPLLVRELVVAPRSEDRPVGPQVVVQNNETGFVPKTAEISPRHSGAFHVAPYQFIGVQFGRIAGKMQRQRTFVDAA
jgi:hypothetical protein